MIALIIALSVMLFFQRGRQLAHTTCCWVEDRLTYGVERTMRWWRISEFLLPFVVISMVLLLVLHIAYWSVILLLILASVPAVLVFYIVRKLT